MNLEGRRQLKDVRISRIQTPVNETTMRGGVYVSEKSAYKMHATINDVTVISHLTRMMLGPSTEFEQIRITVRTPRGKFYILGNITDSVQRPDSVEIGMTIIKVGPA
ncbi:MAG: hypothetical protein D9C04_03155 [Nitrosopumilus sp. B06]|nr:MAG: hypothetical protein D9C04_03155 [Nitrosopumilus sp. B06]